MSGGRLDLMDLRGKGVGEAKTGSILSGNTETYEAVEIMDWLMVIGRQWTGRGRERGNEHGLGKK